MQPRSCLVSLSTIRATCASRPIPDEGPEPVAVDRLSGSESLLLSAIRAWISASCRWATIQSDFRSILGKDEGAASLIGLQALLIFIALGDPMIPPRTSLRATSRRLA